jgi:uroporphyrinogen decarboxylase
MKFFLIKNDILTKNICRKEILMKTSFVTPAQSQLLRTRGFLIMGAAATQFFAGHSVRTTVKNAFFQLAAFGKARTALAEGGIVPPAIGPMMNLTVEAQVLGAQIFEPENSVPAVYTTDGAAIINNLKTDLSKLRVPQSLTEVASHEAVVVNQNTLRRLVNSPKFKDIPIKYGVALAPFSLLASRLMNINYSMLAMMDSPEIFKEGLEKIMPLCLMYAEILLNENPEAIIFCDPSAGLMGPGMIREFSTPYNRRLIDLVHSRGKFAVLHNCGDAVHKGLLALLETGADVIHIGNKCGAFSSMAKIAPQVPAPIILGGNIDPVLLATFTPEAIARITEMLAGELRPFSNTFLSSGCDLPPDARPENIVEFYRRVAAARLK